MSNQIKLISIPDYFRDYVDPNVDLNTTHNIPCPFHDETEGKSFTYSPDKHVWRCWGKCHCGGDVIDLHRLHYHLSSREEAKRSLTNLLGIEEDDKPVFTEPVIRIDEVDIERREAYAKALRVAKTPDDWIKLDYILGKHPFDLNELLVFIGDR